MTRPTMFIGSSKEALPVARAVKARLSTVLDVTIWDQALWPLSKGTLETLEQSARESDFGLFVLGRDDLTVSRHKQWASTRDNVILELGMFLGALNRNRCFWIIPDGSGFKVPSDLLGITAGVYGEPSKSRPLSTAVKSACDAIKKTVTPYIGASHLAGKWSQEWEVTIGGLVKRNRSSATIVQIGDECRGAWTFRGGQYLFTGRLRGQFITGTWYSPLSTGYHGSFQLKVDPMNKTLDGRWVGWSNGGDFRDGKWTWKRK